VADTPEAAPAAGKEPAAESEDRSTASVITTETAGDLQASAVSEGDAREAAYTATEEGGGQLSDPAYFDLPPEQGNDGQDQQRSDAPVIAAVPEDMAVPQPAEAEAELDEGFFFSEGELRYAGKDGEIRETGGWFNLNGNTYYSNEDGSFCYDCTMTLGDYRFGFDEAGRLLIGFFYKDGYLRYQDPVTFEPRETVGWFTVNGKTYFSDKNGNIYHECFIHTTETDYYWMSADGSIQPGTTVVVGGIPYDLDENGMVVHTGGWGESADGRKFYRDPESGMPLRDILFDPDGEGECYAGRDAFLATGWAEAEGRWMYFDRESCRRVFGRFDEEALNGFNGQYYYTAMPGMSYGCCTGFVGFMTYNLMGIEDYPHTRSTASHRNGGEYVDGHMIWLMENADMVGYATTENRKVVYHGETYQPGDIIVFNNRSDAYLGELSPGISSQNFDTWKVDGYAILEHIAIVGWNTSGVPAGQYNMHHNTSSRNIINQDSPEQFILSSPPNGSKDGRSRSYYVFRLRTEGAEEPPESEEQP